MTGKHIHPLLIRGEQLTEKVAIWKLREHPHKLLGSRRGFQVRVYHYPTADRQPYLVTIVSEEGFVMDAEELPTADAANSAALERLSGLTPDDEKLRRPAPSSEAVQMAQAHADRVEHLTDALIAAIEAAAASYPQAKHALTRTLGALIGCNSESDADRTAALSIATQAIKGCAENTPLVAKYGRRLKANRSRLN